MGTALDVVDPTFVSDLNRSKEAVWRASRWLSDQGFHVVVAPTIVRPDPSVRDEYGDDGDIQIVQRVEIKRRPGIHFTGRDDFPYPSIIVDVAHAWDRAHPKPYAYMIFNDDMTHCCIVKGDTSKHWSRTSKFARGREREYLECPIEFCRFKKVSQ
jgi:hypothetical protein